MNNNALKSWLFFALLVCLALANYYYYNAYEPRKLNEEFGLTAGRIKTFGATTRKNDVSASFVFSVEGVEYKGFFKKDVFCKNLTSTDKARLSNEEFIVVYYPRDPEICRILLAKEDYETYNVSIPGYLNDVIGAYFECNRASH